MTYLLNRIDTIWEHTRNYSNVAAEIVERPSSYFTGRIYGCFFDDDFGLSVRDAVGITQITFESDYPHQDSTWPNTNEYARRSMCDLTQYEVDRVARENAIDLLSLPLELPQG